MLCFGFTLEQNIKIHQLSHVLDGNHHKPSLSVALRAAAIINASYLTPGIPARHTVVVNNRTGKLAITFRNLHSHQLTLFLTLLSEIQTVTAGPKVDDFRSVSERAKLLPCHVFAAIRQPTALGASSIKYFGRQRRTMTYEDMVVLLGTKSPTLPLKPSSGKYMRYHAIRFKDVTVWKATILIFKGHSAASPNQCKASEERIHGGNVGFANGTYGHLLHCLRDNETEANFIVVSAIFFIYHFDIHVIFSPRKVLLALPVDQFKDPLW